MLATELPIVTLVRPEQPEKAKSPMLVTESGMVMLVRPVQPQKAYSPMLETESGMPMLVILLLFINVRAGMVFASEGISIAPDNSFPLT